MRPLAPSSHLMRRASVLALVACASSACERAHQVGIAEAAPVQARAHPFAAPSEPDRSQEPLGIEPYAPGRWRLARPENLEESSLWVSHILIRHEGSPRTAAFSKMPLPWTPEPDAPARSRARALELALDVAAQARAAEHAFARLAREYSEDVTTRDAAGSLGGVNAATLVFWPQILDALAALSPGDVSRPVETEFGFHVLSLRTPPSNPNRASGRRIVIGYDDAPWLSVFLPRRTIPKRTRREAEVLAWELFQRAREQPGEFSKLVAEYTEHQDALRGGDFGSWSNLERAPFPREIERLHSLAEGEVGAPLDSIYGFQVIQRVPERQRQRYAMRLIQIAPFPLQENSGAAAREALSELQRVAGVLSREPSRFEAFQAELCCSDYVEEWEEGRASVFAERALAALRIGQIASEPADLGALRYAIVERLEPRPEDPLPSSYALPAPAQPDALAFCADTARLDVIQVAKETVARELKLPPLAASQLAKLHEIETLPWQAASSEERLAFLRALQPKLAQLLGPDGHDRYRDILAREVEQTLLRVGPHVWL